MPIRENSQKTNQSNAQSSAAMAQRGEFQSESGSASNAAAPGTAAPSISLPKGGGAIRGIGEKFAANPVTGTGSMSVPIATSPGRSGFGPQLSLSYDSGAGNGPFGFGWSLSLPQITRKTDKGLPKYQDAEESDVFILSGAEDLVPEFKKKPNGEWEFDANGNHLFAEEIRNGYRIRRYRPRIEGLFARIERWTNAADPSDVHWRSISKDNILTIYGRDENSRIIDPEDSSRIFTWLICETRDDKGNAVLYGYKPEDGAGVDLTQAHERNRGDRADIRRAANRYLKRIYYGNRTTMLDSAGLRPPFLTTAQIQNAGWMFEVVFDYGEHDSENPQPSDDPTVSNSVLWPARNDSFSTYRAGFEVRTTRLCQRVLMFHHFPDEENVGADCLVRSTDFSYSHEQNPTSARNPVYTFLRAVTQSGYKRDNGGYLKRSLPPVEFEYSQPIVQDLVEEVDPESMKNLPIGVDGTSYLWTDLHGEGIPGILTEQGGAWFYKRNLSSMRDNIVEFAPLERVAVKPNLALASGAQFMDLAGDGQPDLVVLDGSMPGFYEHDDDEGWQSFRPFTSRLNHDFRDPNLKLVDLDGDGHADVLITEDNALIWHPSLAEKGFDSARRVAQAWDEEKGPRLVFADGTQSIYLADMCGDGLTDLVRIRNGEICYWPNLGYGRFGAKVTMDNAPHFDNPDQFDHKRIRLADIDGSGTTDIIYLHRDGMRLYFNQSGNSWSAPQHLNVFPRVDDLVNITTTDLLGNGTACLVWSSPLPGDATRPMRYINLMGGQKPHLLIKTVNNLGAETRVQYAPSTKFYLQDKYDDKPWITRLPFPVHVVERVETYDHISGNRFVSRYAYHHGYFDGEEREFRNFGMVEQWDTEEFAALIADGTFPEADNIDAASHVPPVLTKSWFHTGIYLDREHVSRQFEVEYYCEPDLSDQQFREQLLPDTVLPADLTLDEEHEACRAIKGSMLRQEVYALDNTSKAEHPYTVVEQNFTIHTLQPRGGNRHAVFIAHPREAITYHYERNPGDPRVQHALTLETDDYGNVLKQAAIGYGRREPDDTLPQQADRDKQTRILITYTENSVTNDIDEAETYRTPLPCETRTYELNGFSPENNAAHFSFDEWTRNGFALPASATEVPYEQTADFISKQKRLIEQVRTLYRRNDLTAPLPFGVMQSFALPFESYKLAFTPGLIRQVYNGRVTDALLSDEGKYVNLDEDDSWWIPSGQIFYSPNVQDTPEQELDFAQKHFFLPHRFRDPFSNSTIIYYDDPYKLLMMRTTDPLNNEIKAENDYRVLQPWQVTDPNGNRTAVAFDALGLVVATAVMGKVSENRGDLLEDFDADPPLADLQAFIADPKARAVALLGKATSRIVYDLERYQRADQPPFAATLARETHFYDPLPAGGLKIQISFSYSDGFGREIQKKIQAEAGDAPQRQTDVPLPSGDIQPGDLVRDAQGKLIQASTQHRWVGSGRTVFNNKGKPVRQYEPFFSATHLYEPEREMTDTGVTPILFYDPVERVVATLHPNHTYEKMVFDPWQQTTWDVNDTVLGDPRTDPDIAGYVGKHFKTQPADWQTWYVQRQGSALGAQEQAAANKAADHADTPAMGYFDTLGRPFLTFVDNGPDPANPGKHLLFATRVELDIEGNQREVIDARNRVVMRYDYYMAGPEKDDNTAGNRIHQVSMDAGDRWMLNNVTGKPIRAWDSRNHELSFKYDELRRPTETRVKGGDGLHPLDHLYEKMIYGENQTLNGKTDKELNLRGKPFIHYDTAGKIQFEGYDFKGNLKKSHRRLAKEYKKAVQWDVANPDTALENESFAAETAYDALNRIVWNKTPDGSITKPFYNEANLLDKIEVTQQGPAELFVTNIDYNAKGQRTLIDYGNGVNTEYQYDPETFRLTLLKTTRERDGALLQNLSYTYDPTGNITEIRDDARQTIYFGGEVVTPSAHYVYDALYRLIKADGREHIGQTEHPQPEYDWDDHTRTNLAHPNDGQKMRRYTEQYNYDQVGNILNMIHKLGDAPGGETLWNRWYQYALDSNRLMSTSLDDEKDKPFYSDGYEYSAEYHYDAHGNMIKMLHLPQMQWDFKDQLQATSGQVVNHGGTPETTYYVYDSSGQRVRKVNENYAAAGNAPSRKEERIYIGGAEVYRKHTGNYAGLERWTLHVMDDKSRIAMVETRNEVDDGTGKQLIRYQFSNHLGTACLETDGSGREISYEEYHPYGTTAYQAVIKDLKTSAKRYRYSGKEQDKESGLYYYGARCYAKWLSRWLSCDPMGMKDSINLYTYVLNCPTIFIDPSGSQIAGQRKPERPASSTGSSDADKNVHLIIVGSDYNRLAEGSKAFTKRVNTLINNMTIIERFPEKVDQGDRIVVIVPSVIENSNPDLINELQTYGEKRYKGRYQVKVLPGEKLEDFLQKQKNIKSLFFFGHGEESGPIFEWSADKFTQITSVSFFKPEQFAPNATAYFITCNSWEYAYKFTLQTKVSSIGTEGTTFFDEEVISAAKIRKDFPYDTTLAHYYFPISVPSVSGNRYGYGVYDNRRALFYSKFSISKVFGTPFLQKFRKDTNRSIRPVRGIFDLPPMQ